MKQTDNNLRIPFCFDSERKRAGRIFQLPGNPYFQGENPNLSTSRQTRLATERAASTSTKQTTTAAGSVTAPRGRHLSGGDTGLLRRPALSKQHPRTGRGAMRQAAPPPPVRPGRAVQPPRPSPGAALRGAPVPFPVPLPVPV